MQGQPVRKVNPQLIAVICFVCLIAVVSWLVTELWERFPRLPEGSYMGSISGLTEGSSYPFLVESAGNDDLFFVVLAQEWQGQLITGAPTGKGGSSSTWYHPIIINSPMGRLVFTGASQGAGEFEGDVSLPSGESASWTLHTVQLRDSGSAGVGESEMKLWLRIKGELDEIEQRLLAAEKRVPEQKREIEQLTEYMTQGGSLKESGDAKFKAVQAELDEVKSTFRELQSQGKQLERQIELSETVTKRGQLVSLSRTSLEREARWIESMMRSTLPGGSEELAIAVQQGEKIREVQRAIAIERERIYRLRERAKGGTRVGSQPESFDSIWGGQ